MMSIRKAIAIKKLNKELKALEEDDERKLKDHLKGLISKEDYMNMLDEYLEKATDIRVKISKLKEA